MKLTGRQRLAFGLRDIAAIPISVPMTNAERLRELRRMDWVDRQKLVKIAKIGFQDRRFHWEPKM